MEIIINQTWTYFIPLNYGYSIRITHNDSHPFEYIIYDETNGRRVSGEITALSDNPIKFYYLDESTELSNMPYGRIKFRTKDPVVIKIDMVYWKPGAADDIEPTIE